MASILLSAKLNRKSIQQEAFMAYAERELAYCLPFVEALESDNDFKAWVISRTPFQNVAFSCRLLKEDMTAKRPNAKYYWRSFYTEKCCCPGDCGQETDILSVFDSSKVTFALHIEVKQPNDKFKNDGRQARSYPIRAACWADSDNGPATLVPHEQAATVLLCSKNSLNEFEPHLIHFDTILTFEEINRRFPNVYPEQLLDS